MSSELVKNIIVRELFLMILRTGTSSCRVPLIQLHVASCCNVWQPVDLGNMFGCGVKLLQDIVYDNPGPPGPCVVECLLKRQKIVVGGVLNSTNLKENWKMPYSICWEAVTGYVNSLNVSFQDWDSFSILLGFVCTASDAGLLSGKSMEELDTV